MDHAKELDYGMPTCNPLAKNFMAKQYLIWMFLAEYTPAILNKLKELRSDDEFKNQILSLSELKTEVAISQWIIQIIDTTFTRIFDAMISSFTQKVHEWRTTNKDHSLKVTLPSARRNTQIRAERENKNGPLTAEIYHPTWIIAWLTTFIHQYLKFLIFAHAQKTSDPRSNIVEILKKTWDTTIIHDMKLHIAMFETLQAGAEYDIYTWEWKDFHGWLIRRTRALASQNTRPSPDLRWRLAQYKAKKWLNENNTLPFLYEGDISKPVGSAQPFLPDYFASDNLVLRDGTISYAPRLIQEVKEAFSKLVKERMKLWQPISQRITCPALWNREHLEKIWKEWLCEIAWVF